MTTAQQQSNTTASQTGTANQNQTSVSNPWAPAQHELTGLLGSIPSAGVTPQQTAALNNLYGSVQGLPNYGPTAVNTANAFLTGDPTGLLYTGNQNLQNTLSPIANQPLDPTKSPIVQNLLDNIKQQVTTSTNANAAAAGRSLNSGDNAAATSYGLASAELPTLLGQYNTNQQNVMNAGSQMFGANYGTANAGAGNIGTGLNMAAAVPSYFMQNPLAQLQAANTGQQLPFQNIGTAENLTIPIAGLGGTSFGTGNSNTSQNGTSNTNTTITPSLLQSIGAFGGILGGTGGLFGGAAPVSSNLLGLLQGAGNGILGAFK